MVINWLVVAVAAYLLGSIPSGLLIGRLVFGVDVREYGSRRTGATNVLRTLGTKAAVAALLMDIGKGIAAVALARVILPESPWAHVLAAFLAAAGHNWPIFVGFRGGRGVVVSAAALIVLKPEIFLFITVVSSTVVWRTRYVSLGSVVGALLSPLAGIFFYLRGEMPLAYLIFTIIGAVLVVSSHKDNITRLMAGTENRLGQRVQPTT